MEGAIRFPLLHLHKDVIVNFVKTMTVVQLFGFSLISKKSKNLVNSINLTTSQISIHVSDILILYVCPRHGPTLMCAFYGTQEDPGPRRLVPPPDVVVMDDGPVESVQILNSDGRAMSWYIDRVKEIFHYPGITLDFMPNANQFDLQSIYETIRGIERMSLNDGDQAYNQEILRRFKPTRLSMEEDAVPQSKDLIQNFNALWINTPALQVSLDGLLLINSLEVSLSVVGRSGKVVNRYLKLWMKGSNPRMEMLQLRFSNDTPFSEEDVLRGLQYQDSNEMRYFKGTGRKAKRRIGEGLDICRFDGIKATFYAEVVQNFVVFEMVVWHQHCVVEETDL